MSVADPVSRAGNATLGRLFSLDEPLYIDRDLLRSPVKARKEIEGVVDDFEDEYPEELKNTEVQLGGRRFLHDWGRTMFNPKSGPLGKVVGTVKYPFSYLSSVLGLGGDKDTASRVPTYDSLSDQVIVPGKSMAGVEDALGRAVHFNRMDGIERDLNSVIHGLPLVSAAPRMRGSRLADPVREKRYKNPDDLIRAKSISSANIGGSMLSEVPFVPMPNLIGGAVAGLYREQKEQDKMRRERDGDGDGKVNDGTRREKTVKKSSDLYRQFLTSRDRLVRSLD